MEEFWTIVIIVLLISGGGCSLAGTWWQKRKHTGECADEGLEDERSQC